MLRSRPLSSSLSVLLLVAFSQSRVAAQTNLPVPEFYGIYAVTDGKLVKLDGREIRSERSVNIPLSQRAGVVAVRDGAQVATTRMISVPVFSADLKIIVYSESNALGGPLQMAQTFSVAPLAYVRTLAVDTGFPNNVKRRGPVNGWEIGNAPELMGLATGDHPEDLEMLMKPVAGQKEMVLAGFAQKLRPGVYRLSLGRVEPIPIPGSAAPGLLFAVEPVKDSETTMCVDAAVTYAMAVSNARYYPCSKGGLGAATAASPSATPRERPANIQRPTVDGPLAQWIAGDSAGAAAAAQKLLDSGGSLTVPIAHYHSMGLCTGTLKLQRGKLSFDGSKSDGFEIGPDGLAGVTVHVIAKGMVANEQLPDYPIVEIRWKNAKGKESKYQMLAYMFAPAPNLAGKNFGSAFPMDQPAIGKMRQFCENLAALIQKNLGK